jgi:hypothetical protein
METNYGNTEPVSVGEWIVTYLITAIPLVGIVMLFVWAFGDSVKPSKANWAKASLIMAGISLLLSLCIGGLFFLLAMGSSGQLQ